MTANPSTPSERPSWTREARDSARTHAETGIAADDAGASAMAERASEAERGVLRDEGDDDAQEAPR